MAPELEDMARQYALADQEKAVLSPLESDRSGKTRFQEMLAGTDLWERMTSDVPSTVPLSDQEVDTLRAAGLEPEGARLAETALYRHIAEVLSRQAPENTVSISDPNIWSENKVRAYLGFEPYPADDGFGAFAEALLEEAFPADPEQVEFPDEDGTYNMRYYFAEQFAAGSVIPGVRALWYQWPNCDWPDFAAWLAGALTGRRSSRRDFLMAGGDFMRVWREVWAVRREVWPSFDGDPETGV